ncbi:Glutaminyl-peptide cyclotransferase [Hypsibius exemplaris]|uniref:glutaminyl-peptide cyclotransferase n=1 Tax=Hypsibius exemplaris TaxID=2072580 RepID=A0A9X6RMQ6_HYPEX|nr:Glutaminyl-peptide cyclotransferase [Hypsibius exemplaris]
MDISWFLFLCLTAATAFDIQDLHNLLKPGTAKSLAFDFPDLHNLFRSTTRHFPVRQSVSPAKKRTVTPSRRPITRSTKRRTTTEPTESTSERPTTERTTTPSTTRTTTTPTTTTTIDPILIPAWQAKQRDNDFIELSGSKREALMNLSNKDRFMKTLLPIAVPRVAGTPESLKVQKFIKSKLSELSYTIKLDQFISDPPEGHEPCNMTNIIATLNPEAPRKLVLACHYDSKFDKEGLFVGLSDSAAPCAMMLDLAESLHPFLTNRIANLNVTLQLMFLDGEEAVEKWSTTDSLYGARNLATKMEATHNEFAHENSTLTELHSIDFMILLDLIGTKDTQFRAFYYTARGQFERLAEIEESALQRDKVRTWGREKPYFDVSPIGKHAWVDDDYRPFIEKGVKILHLVSWPFPTVWHKLADNLDALHYDTVDDILKILRVYLCEYLNCTV